MNLFDRTFGEYLTILSIVLIIIILYNIFTKGYEHMSDVYNSSSTRWSRNTCNYLMNSTLEDELKSNNITYSKDNWNLYFPCAYDEIDKEISQMPVVEGAKYFIIDTSDIMVAKEWLWRCIVVHYGLDKAKTMIPMSYVLNDDVDMQRFSNDFNGTRIYIMKKNIQRQEGLKITNSKDDILNGKSQGYVVVQELLQDPYLISGRKTNMRFYVLVVCYNGQITVYVYNDGFMYYTKDPFVKGSLETAPNITTGYIDRQVYVDNPLTHNDLKTYLDNPNRENLYNVEKGVREQGIKISHVYFDRIYSLLKDVFMAFVGRICKLKQFNNNTMFQLFGVDIAVNDNLNPMIMEINKGPDLGAKDERDSKLKHGVVKDTLNLIGAIDNSYYSNYVNGFIKILDVG